MNHKRRQFLLLIISLCSLGLAILTHIALTDARSQPSSLNPVPSKQLETPVREEIRIVVISDLNSQYGSTTYEPEVDRAIALIPGWKPDLVLCGGDMIAGQKPL